MVLDRAHQPPQRRPMDLARYHLDAMRHLKTTMETRQAVETRPEQILAGHDLTEGSEIQANLEACAQ